MVTLSPILFFLIDQTGGNVFVITQETEDGPVRIYYIFPDKIENVVLPTESTTVYEKVVRIKH